MVDAVAAYEKNEVSDCAENSKDQDEDKVCVCQNTKGKVNYKQRLTEDMTEDSVSLMMIVFSLIVLSVDSCLQAVV